MLKCFSIVNVPIVKRKRFLKYSLGLPLLPITIGRRVGLSPLGLPAKYTPARPQSNQGGVLSPTNP